MQTIPASATEFLAEITSALGDPADLAVETPAGGRFIAVFLSSFAVKREIQDNILTPLVEAVRIQPKADWERILAALPGSGRREHHGMETVIGALLDGYTVLHQAGSRLCYSFDTHKEIQKPPAEPLIERTIRGPKLSLVENLSDNLLLLRRTIKDPRLRLDGVRVGRRTRTRLAVLYLEDVADPGVVAEVHRRLGRIDIDGVVDSGYIEQLITDNRWSLFPLIQSTERPDKVVAAVLEGRVAILVDGSANAILVPVTVNELYQSPEDYYFSFWFGVFLRALRILGNNIAVALPGLYIALVGVNPELLPIRFALTATGSRMGVALPILLELLLMEIAVEIFREGSLRLPTTVSQTLGVTAGIVLGLAAVGAGLVSNATLVVVVVTAIASYSGPNYEIGLSWRILRFVLIFAGAALGLFGLTVAGIIILTHAAIQNSFGVGYLSPWSPLLPHGLIDTVLRRPVWMGRRLGVYHPSDRRRYAGRGGRGNE
ncbi:MAG: spore germination protein [Patescibacteria group bacterium]